MGKSDLRKKFGARFREALNAANIRAADVAKDLGVTPAAVSGWLKGSREPKYEVLAFLYQKYGINPLYIITGQGPPVIEKAKRIDVATLAAKKNIKKFSDRLRKIQKESGLSIKEIATLLNVPEKTAQKWFYGVSYPKPEVLEQLVNVIGANPFYLLTGQGPPILAEGEKSSEEKGSGHYAFDAESWKSAWAPVDHVCRYCGARIMVCRATVSPTGEVYKCFTCGAGGYKPEDICWCGQRFRNSHPDSQNYICLPTRILEEYPEVRELFDDAFRSCGIEPDRVEVGFITFRDFNRIMREAEARRAVTEGGLKAVPRHEKALADIENALEQEKKYLGTPLAAGLFLEKVWRDYLKEGDSPLFVRGLIWKLLEILEKAGERHESKKS